MNRLAYLKSTVRSILLLSAFLVVAVSYQNCDPGKMHFQAQGSDKASGGTGGTGSGLDGKPDVTLILQGVCFGVANRAVGIINLDQEKKAATKVDVACPENTNPIFSSSTNIYDQLQLTYDAATGAVSRASYSGAEFVYAPALGSVFPSSVTGVETMGKIGGQAMDAQTWLLPATYHEVSHTFQFTTSGQFSFDVLAYADLAFGAGSDMELRIDDVTVASVTVGAVLATDYVLSANVTKGAHKVTLVYMNDAYIPGQVDRNLYITRISIRQ